MSHWFDQLAKRAARSVDAREMPPVERLDSPEASASGAKGGVYTRRRGLQLTLLALVGTTLGPVRALLWPTQSEADAYSGCADTFGACNSKVNDNFGSNLLACNSDYIRHVATGDVYAMVALNLCMSEACDTFAMGLVSCEGNYLDCVDDVSGGGSGGGGAGGGLGGGDCTTICGEQISCECELCAPGGSWCGCYCNYSSLPCSTTAC